MSGFFTLFNKFVFIVLVVSLNVRAEIHDRPINNDRPLFSKDQVTQRLLMHIANACGLTRDVLGQDKNDNMSPIGSPSPQDHPHGKEEAPNIPNKKSMINPGMESPEKKPEANNDSHSPYQGGNNANNYSDKNASRLPTPDTRKPKARNSNKSSSGGNSSKSQKQATPPKENQSQGPPSGPPPRDPTKAVLRDSQGERVAIEMRNGKPYCPGHEGETLTADNGMKVKVGSDGSLPPPPRPKRPSFGSIF